MPQNRFPAGWDEERVQKVLAHHETLSEDEGALEKTGQTLMEVPTELVPAVRELIAKHGK